MAWRGSGAHASYGSTSDAAVKLLEHKGEDKAAGEGEDEEEEDCEEEEEQFFHLSERQLLLKAIALLLAGTAVVTIFSDPMVEVISTFGEKIGVSPFYISFVVTPLASNASEVLSGLIFAKKKVRPSLFVSFVFVV
jgi:Ca2+/H+ antiporter